MRNTGLEQAVSPHLYIIGILITRHPGRDCRDPEAMDGDTETTISRIHIPVRWIPAILVGMTVYPRHLCITMSAPAYH